MKVWVDSDEWYPFYNLQSLPNPYSYGGDKPIEIDIKTFKRITALHKEIEYTQREIYELCLNRIK